MVAVEVADEDAGDGRRGDVGVDELPLRPLTWIEEEAFVVPAEEVGVVVSQTRWLLRGAAENC